MENASKALLIAGAILLCILIIAIGMFIYNSAQGTIVSSLNSLSTQEIEAFNNQFMAYQGVQKGINVKNLFEKLIANVNTQVDDSHNHTDGIPEKVPNLQLINAPKDNTHSRDRVSWRTGDNKSNFIDRCIDVKKRIKTNHEYYVYFTYQPNGLIDYICIRYDIPTDFTTLDYKYKREIY